MSYTEFEYSKLSLSSKQISITDLKNGQKVKVSVNVINVGKYDSKETVQLYIHDPVATMMRPLRELKAFKKVFIPSGQSKTVEFELGFEDLGYYLSNGEYIVENGVIEIFVGSDCLTNNEMLLNII